MELLEEYGKDRDGYTAAKGGFVKEITEKAKRKASDTDGKKEGNVQNR